MSPPRFAYFVMSYILSPNDPAELNQVDLDCPRSTQRFGNAVDHREPGLSAIRCSRLFASPINVFTVSHFHHPDCEVIVLD
jgi:hypothetical protein